MKKIIQKLLFIAIVVTIGSCEDNSPEPSSSVLLVDITAIQFTQTDNNKTIIVSNVGQDELLWNITNKPEWLSLSKVGGKLLANQTDTICAEANIIQPIGNYNDKIIITSNSNSEEIAVSYSVQFSIDIFPGIGVANVKLNDTNGTVMNIQGIPNTFITAFDSTGYIIGHIIQYLEKGLGFYLVGSGITPEENDKATKIIIEEPYTGVTEMYVGIGNSLAEVESSYGQPDKEDSENSFWEYSIGIRFYYTDSTKVEKIEIL